MQVKYHVHVNKMLKTVYMKRKFASSNVWRFFKYENLANNYVDDFF